jgi:hypothetical protein
MLDLAAGQIKEAQFASWIERHLAALDLQNSYMLSSINNW